MSSNITTPKNNVPVGRVSINGQTYDVAQHPEFVRFFFDLFRRIGGTNGPSTAELLTLIDDLSGEVSVQRYPSDPIQPQFADALLTPTYEPLPLAVDGPEARVSALEARVDALTRQINDIQQGYQL